MLILSAVFFVAVGLIVLNMCHAAVAERLDQLNNETLSELVNNSMSNTNTTNNTKKVRTTSMSSIESGRRSSELDMLEPLLEDDTPPVDTTNTVDTVDTIEPVDGMESSQSTILNRQKSLSTASIATTIEEEALSRTTKVTSTLIKKLIQWDMMVYNDEE